MFGFIKFHYVEQVRALMDFGGEGKMGIILEVDDDHGFELYDFGFLPHKDTSSHSYLHLSLYEFVS